MAKEDDAPKVDDAEVTETEHDDDTPDDDSTDDTDMAAQLKKWKHQARVNEREAKKNADAARRLAEMEDADKTELERATDKAQSAEGRAAEAEARALRLEVAMEKGLSPNQARRLVGETKEELEADADDLLESFAPGDDDDKPKPGDRKPKAKLKSGNDPDDDDEVDPEALAERIKSRGRL